MVENRHWCGNFIAFSSLCPRVPLALLILFTVTNLIKINRRDAFMHSVLPRSAVRPLPAATQNESKEGFLANLEKRNKFSEVFQFSSWIRFGTVRLLKYFETCSNEQRKG